MGDNQIRVFRLNVPVPRELDFIIRISDSMETLFYSIWSTTKILTTRFFTHHNLCATVPNFEQNFNQIDVQNLIHK